MKRICLLVSLLLIAKFSIAQSGYCRVYIPSHSIHLNGVSNKTYRNLVFDFDSLQVDLRNSHDVNFIGCKFMNAPHNFGIQAKTGCYNITVDSCTFYNLMSGVYIQNGGNNLVITHNQTYNMIGPYPQGHAFQLDQCTGTGILIEYNNCQSDFNAGTGDVINIFKSNGEPGNPIRVQYNNVLGGGTATGGNGSAGLILGDLSGSYQIGQYNIFVNSGAAACAIQGGSNIDLSNNTCFMQNYPWSGFGIAVVNVAGGAPSTNITSGNNRINAYAGQYGRYRDTVHKDGVYPNTMPVPIGWSTNIIDRSLNATVLPASIFETCTLPTITYTTPLTYVYRQNVLIIPTYSNAVVSYTAASLPAGLSINATTGVISGTVTAAKVATAYVITAHNMAGTSNYTITITVNKLPLIITADSKVKNQGQPNPTLTATYFGLYPGDTLTTPPTLSTTAVTGSPAGRYNITASGAVSPNYTITYVPGTLTVIGGHYGGGYKVIFRKAKLG